MSGIQHQEEFKNVHSGPTGIGERLRALGQWVLQSMPDIMLAIGTIWLWTYAAGMSDWPRRAMAISGGVLCVILLISRFVLSRAYGSSADRGLIAELADRNLLSLSNLVAIIGGALGLFLSMSSGILLFAASSIAEGRSYALFRHPGVASEEAAKLASSEMLMNLGAWGLVFLGGVGLVVFALRSIKTPTPAE